MKNKFESIHYKNQEGNLIGGKSSGIGFNIEWQNGPLYLEGKRIEPNGAFVETLLEVVKDRINFYQESKFNCQENDDAINYINKALEALNNRTKKRQERKVEGTWEV